MSEDKNIQDEELEEEFDEHEEEEEKSYFLIKAFICVFVFVGAALWQGPEKLLSQFIDTENTEVVVAESMSELDRDKITLGEIVDSAVELRDKSLKKIEEISLLTTNNDPYDANINSSIIEAAMELTEYFIANLNSGYRLEDEIINPTVNKKINQLLESLMIPTKYLGPLGASLQKVSNDGSSYVPDYTKQNPDYAKILKELELLVVTNALVMAAQVACLEPDTMKDEFKSLCKPN